MPLSVRLEPKSRKELHSLRVTVVDPHVGGLDMLRTHIPQRMRQELFAKPFAPESFLNADGIYLAAVGYHRELANADTPDGLVAVNYRGQERIAQAFAVVI